MAARSSDTRDEADPLLRAEALIAQGKPREACALLKSNLESGRGGLLSRIALGRALLAAGENAESLETLRTAGALAPAVAEPALALGEALLANGHLPTAIAEFERALRLEPGLTRARFALGAAWLEAGEAKRAIEILAPLKNDSSFVEQIHDKLVQAETMLAADRSPEGYVRHLFDQFSASYDARMLTHLRYRAHNILRQLAELVVDTTRGSFEILDLGCGTGLAGEVFKDIAARLVGIDLSPRMIEEARRRGVYDELIVGDLLTILEDKMRAYDLILAADTLVYLGDFGPVLEKAGRRLCPAGVFLFTTEKKSGSSYELGPKRRYRHSEAYIREQAGRAGLEIVGLVDCVPRIEAGTPVAGLAAALQRP